MPNPNWGWSWGYAYGNSLRARQLGHPDGCHFYLTPDGLPHHAENETKCFDAVEQGVKDGGTLCEIFRRRMCHQHPEMGKDRGLELSHWKEDKFTNAAKVSASYKTDAAFLVAYKKILNKKIDQSEG